MASCWVLFVLALLFCIVQSAPSVNIKKTRGKSEPYVLENIDNSGVTAVVINYVTGQVTELEPVVEIVSLSDLGYNITDSVEIEFAFSSSNANIDSKQFTEIISELTQVPVDCLLVNQLSSDENNYDVLFWFLACGSTSSSSELSQLANVSTNDFLSVGFNDVNFKVISNTSGNNALINDIPEEVNANSGTSLVIGFTTFLFLIVVLL